MLKLLVSVIFLNMNDVFVVTGAVIAADVAVAANALVATDDDVTVVSCIC
jgi:hypothetical protein